MTSTRLFTPLTLLCALLLAGCSNPETPQEVTQAFWEAVLENDGETAAELSTLVDESGFDRFGMDWTGAEVSWGRVTVEDGHASIGTTFSGLEATEGKALETTTRLIRINDRWQVDYHHTGDEIEAELRLESLMGSFRSLGDSLRSRFADESEKAAQEMDRLAAEFATLAGEAERELTALVEQYSDNLKREMDQFARSLNEARQQNPDASPDDRQTLEQAQEAIQDQQETLEREGPDAATEVSRELARIQQQLSELSGRSYDQLKKELAGWMEQLNRELESLNRQAREQQEGQ
ncbi:hypothetical protein [Marinobacter sp.]|uniref:hypothetical protein n=1 Tax=Marinobacter sp. TaxID=50741 RepID=UPI00356AA5EB